MAGLQLFKRLIGPILSNAAPQFSSAAGHLRNSIHLLSQLALQVRSLILMNNSTLG